MLLAGYQKGQGGKMDGFLFFRYSIFLSGDTCSSLSSSKSVRYLLWMKSTSIQLHILLFQRKESQVLMFYWNIFKWEQPPLLWWCWKWGAAFSAKPNLLARLMPHSSAGLPRRWPGADAVKLRGDFVGEIILLCCSTVVSVPGPRRKTPYVKARIQRVQAHFLAFTWSITVGLLQGEAPIILQ